LTALYSASGLFASSLTESAMLAVFMAVVFNLLIWFVGQAGANSDIKWWASVSEYISVGQHLVNFLKGVIKISSLVFFISVTGFFVFLSQRVVESTRWR
jgi:ABC-2 type transport system permease protein